MRYLFMLVLLSFTQFALAAQSTSSANDNVVNHDATNAKVEANAQKLTLQNNQWRTRLHNEINSVKNDEKQLSNRLTNKQNQLAKLNANIAKLTKQKKQLTGEYSDAVNNMSLVKATYQKALTTLSQQWQHSPTQLITLERNENINQAISATQFPTLAKLNSLVNLAVNDMKLTGKISHNQAEISFADGSVSQQKVTVIGGLMATIASNPSGFISFTNTLPQAVIPDASSISQRIDLWQNQQSKLLPVDLSQGHMLAHIQTKETLAQWINKGGAVVWPILILAVIGALIICWRGMLLFYWRTIPTQLLEQNAQSELSKQHVLDTIKLQLNQIKRVPAAAALACSICDDSNLESMDKRLHNSMLKQMSRFELGLGFIALLAAMAPMLGLLGTVSGMIETFQSLTEFGNSDPKLLSEGISKALITTQAGLLVALFLLLCHYPLKRRAQKLSLDMEQQAALLLAINIEQGEQHA